MAIAGQIEAVPEAREWLLKEPCVPYKSLQAGRRLGVHPVGATSLSSCVREWIASGSWNEVLA